jgi:putative NADH-flavin reductase
LRIGTDESKWNLKLKDVNSRISIEDYAIAAVDEPERPEHRGERFTIGY